MSWYEISSRMNENVTDGTEYCINDEEKEEVIKAKTRVGHCNCDYCGKEVLVIFDKNKDDWYGFLGNQAIIDRNYRYSPIIQILRKGPVINRLYNLHARIHCKDWSIRCKSGSLKILCNECFMKTYNRYQVIYKGKLCAVSVVKDRGETIEGVLDELGMLKDSEILGIGSKF